MKKIQVFSIVAFLLLAVLANAENKSAVVLRIYVYARTNPEGFVDSSRIAESVRDLRENLSKRKGVGIAVNESEADVTIEVIRSGVVAVGQQTNTNVNSGVFGGIHANTSTSTVTLPSMAATLRVKGSDYSKPLEVTAQMFWKDLAKQIGNQAVSWLNTNWAQVQKTLNK